MDEQTMLLRLRALGVGADMRRALVNLASVVESAEQVNRLAQYEARAAIVRLVGISTQQAGENAAAYWERNRRCGDE